MKDLTEGNVFSHIVRFSFPMLLGSIFQQLYNVVDSIIVGNYIGKEALAAVGVSFPLMFVLSSMIMGLTMGMSVVISQFYGAKRIPEVKRAIDTLVVVIIIAGIIVGILGFLFSKPIFLLMQVPTEAFDGALVYFRIFIAGIIFMFGYNGISSVMRGLGDSKTPLYFLIVATILNIILDSLFVIVFKMGIASVAVATVIAQAVSCVGLIAYLNHKNGFIRIRFYYWRFDKKIFKESLRIGLPSGIQQTVVSVGRSCLVAIVNSFGVDTTAGFAIAIRLDAFAMMPIMNISLAVTSFVGQNIGAGLIHRVRSALRSSLLLSWGISIFLGLIFIFGGGFLCSLFTNDSSVVVVGKDYLRIMGGFFSLCSTMFMLTAVFRGAGDSLAPMFITSASFIIFKIPIAYFLSRSFTGLGSKGIWWADPVSWFFGLTLSLIYYKSGKWKNKAVVRVLPLEQIALDT